MVENGSIITLYGKNTFLLKTYEPAAPVCLPHHRKSHDKLYNAYIASNLVFIALTRAEIHGQH